jgi:two-component system sensor histidine kinase EvgS
MKAKNHILLRPLLSMLPPVVAFILQWMFWDVIQPYVWFLFFPAVFISAWIGGLIPGLVSTFISAILVWWFFIPPQFSFDLKTPMSLVSIGMFCIMGVLFSITLDRLKKLIQQAGKAQRLSEQRLLSALEWSHTGGWDLDLIDHTAYRTLEHARIFGYESPLPKWTYEMFLEHVLPEDRFEVDRLFNEAVAAQANWDFECRIRRADGEVRWLWVAGGHQRDGDGTVRRMSGIVHDITQQKQTELEIIKLNKELAQRVAERTAELEQTLSTLRDNSARISAMFDTVVDGIITIDEHRIIETFNPAAERIFGYAAVEVIGKNINILMPEPYCGEHDRYVEHYISTGEARVIGIGREVVGRCKSGNTFPMELAVSEMKLGSRRYFTGIVRDITERKQAERLLHQAKEKAENANHAKDSFLATMSHEIRTPLTGMLGMLELLSLSQLDNEQRTTLDVAWDSGRGLLRIVSDILDWSKIEEGKLQLSPRPTSIAQLHQEVVNTYSRVASTKSLILSQHTDARLSSAHIVDPLRLSQVLNNFVSNAIKFTQRGEIEVRAELVDQREGGERIRFSVKDTGIGIAKDIQEHLFQRYRQESADTARMYGGTGLGLAICRRLAEMMDGEIELKSEPGLGSIFSIVLTLPVTAAPVEAVRNLHTEVEQRAVKPLVIRGMEVPLILAVDDHPTNRELLARQIKILGLQVETAENGQVALSMWRDGRFTLIITDCHMPEMDGYMLSQKIRKAEAEETRPRTPIIAWTANALAEEAEHCHDAGMDDLLVKPADLMQLRKMLAKWLSIPEAGNSQVKRSQSDTDSGHVPLPIDYSVLNQVVTDKAEQIKVLQDFQSHIFADHAKLLAMFEQDDFANVGSTTHRMKGSCQMVGAKYLATACEDIEQAARNGNMAGARTAMVELGKSIKQLETYFIEAGISGKK